jgi:rhodanese-related sulfurtransferase
LADDGGFAVVTPNRFQIMRTFIANKPLLVIAMAFAGIATPALAQAGDIPESQRIQPAELVKILQSSKIGKPLMIQVGSHVLFSQAHIPGSEFIGPATDEMAVQQLRKRVASLSHKKFIVLYCGCCPWSHCPNVKPAYDALRSLGFSNVKVLYMANNFGADWVDKGYPAAKGD